jgi:hypothetical protein
MVKKEPVVIAEDTELGRLVSFWQPIVTQELERIAQETAWTYPDWAASEPSLADPLRLTGEETKEGFAWQVGWAGGEAFSGRLGGGGMVARLEYFRVSLVLLPEAGPANFVIQSRTLELSAGLEVADLQAALRRAGQDGPKVEDSSSYFG